MTPQRTPTVLLLCLLAPALLGGCEARTSAEGEGSGYGGRVLDEPVPRPDFTLTDAGGRPFDFRKETEGRLTFLFFGFTNCPDACPVHMSNLAAVLEQKPPDVRRDVSVVFVTTDPERDTPEQLRGWLDSFSRRFVGLRGSREEVNAIERSLGLPPSVVETDEESGEPFVGHSTQMLAFTDDDTAHISYPFGTRQLDLARDLPRLLDGWRGP